VSAVRSVFASKTVQRCRFIDRKLFPTVDSFSGIIYPAMDIPMSFFTVIFAVGRVAG